MSVEKSMLQGIDENLPYLQFCAFGLNADHAGSFIAFRGGIHELTIDDDLDRIA